ncbi:hypothetical protein BRX37_16655 [Sphingomonas sp. S-NIH.Pt3_0716]|nr:hypothetical protein BRX37_16655 [Sphingomonas sp. S-NIH.Pt3_0716]
MTDKTKRRLLMIEVPRDELALRIACKCTGMRAPTNLTATAALDQLNIIQGAGGGQLPMGDGFREAADAAVAYFHECISAGLFRREH